MWYECIPAAAIMTVCLSLPNVAQWGLNNLFYGNAYKRIMEERWDRILYVRDQALTGNVYVTNGLETIPDEPETK